MASRPLAQVEWQLIMQFCDLPSLLSLARCNHDTLRAASNEFAWSTLAPVIFRSTRPHLASSIAGSLLRHTDIGVRWCASSAQVDVSAGLDADDEEMLSITSVPRLRLLDVRDRFVPATRLHSTLQLLPDLTALYSKHNSDVRQTSSVIAWHAPRLLDLRTLHIAAPSNGQAHDVLEQILRATGLTDIGFTSAADITQMQSLLNYTGRLPRLSLRELDGNVWQPVLTAANMRGLRELTLGQVTARHANGTSKPAFAIDWPACFSNLQSLRTLTLEQCGSVDCMLPAIADHAAVSLSELRILLRADGLVDPMYTPQNSFPRRAGSAAPSPKLLHRLLTQRLQCQLTIQFETKATHVQARIGAMAASEREWDSAYAAYSKLAPSFSPRVLVRCAGAPPPADAERPAFFSFL